jgi:hypothetical protein
MNRLTNGFLNDFKARAKSDIFCDFWNESREVDVGGLFVGGVLLIRQLCDLLGVASVLERTRGGMIAESGAG